MNRARQPRKATRVAVPGPGRGPRWGIIPSLFLGFGLLLPGLGGCGKTAPLGRPNIVLITVDTMRADRLGCYGNPGARTPAIDRLASSGVLFTDMSTSVPLTLPSHATFLTGLYPSTHGVHDNGAYRLADDRTTLAEHLSRAGYRTAAFVASFQLDRKYGLAQGFDLYDDRMPEEFRIHDPRIVAGPAADEIRRNASQRRADAVTTLARDWLRQRSDKPFFLWLHYFDPHEIYDPPPPFDSVCKGEPFPVSAYDGEIAFLDHEIGRFISILSNLDIYNRTMIILAADHGEGLGEHQEVYHDSFLYDTTLRVPLLLSGGAVPGSWPSLVADPVRSVDVLPTVLAAIGVPAGPETEGTSLLPLLAGEERGAGWWSYLETYSPSHNRTAKLFGLRTNRWKYIDAPIPELYDVAKDPGETMNLVETDADTARALRATLESGLRSEREVRVPVDEATREKLAAIGYVQEEEAAPDSEASRRDPKELIGCIEGLHLAMRHYTYGRLDSSLAILEGLLDCPGKARIRDHIAKIEVRLGRYDRLVDRFSEIVRSEPGDAKARFWLGLGFLQTGRTEPALDSFLRAVELDPGLALAHYHAGVAYEKLGRNDDAIRAWERSMRADPNGQTGLLARRSRDDLLARRSAAGGAGR